MLLCGHFVTESLRFGDRASTVWRMKSPTKTSLAALCVAILMAAPHAAKPQESSKPGTPVPPLQTFALTDTKELTPAGVKAEAVEYRGRKALRLTTLDGSEDGFAFLNGAQFHDGSIEVDIATHVTTPPGVRMPGFTGIAFRVSSDCTHHDMFYLRPGNSRAEDQAMRNHSVQYIAAPGFPWERLRRQWPFIYESYAELQLDEWTKVKIEVHGRLAKLFVNGSDQPSLIVDGLKGEDLAGSIALWGYAGEEAYFSNLRIANSAPDPVENGAEAAGTWDVKFATDAGPYAGTLKLVRQGNTLAGIWSGAFGPDQSVNGVWRNGYVELSFSGTWPEQPGSVMATLAGWFDGDTGKGRMKVEGRADGRWNATRSK
jgi:hypothetical protein